MTVAKKNKTATGVTWTVPGIMGGNAVPGWEDQQGSIIRRIVLFIFSKTVRQVDTQLTVKLLAEMPALILKCNRAYLDAVEKVGDRQIWDVLPAYFKTTQRDMAKMVNSMHGFLESEAVQYSDSYYCALTDMSKSWSKWVTEQHISPKPRWTADLYSGPIEVKGLRIVKESRRWPRDTGPRRKANYVVGVELAENVVMEDDEENCDPNMAY